MVLIKIENHYFVLCDSCSCINVIDEPIKFISIFVLVDLIDISSRLNK
jgi:hypothetical protein